MSKEPGPPHVRAIHEVLDVAGATAYVKTPSPAALAAVMDAVARLDNPPTVRILARRQPIAGWLRRSTPQAREPIDEEAVELRASPTVVTDTTVVTEGGLARFGRDECEKPTSSGRRAFVESVYEAHARAWKRADPVVAGERRAVSG